MASWHLDTFWLDVSVFLFLILLGHILLGHFEDYRPKWRRVLKACISLALFLALLAAFGRFWAWMALGVPVMLGVVAVHGWWLPKHGINGWTGEPREKYLELVGAGKNSRASARPGPSG